MGESDDPRHPLYPAFESPDAVPTKAWIVLYEGLSGRWLATSPFYVEELATEMGSKYDRGVKILELTVTNVRDLPMEERTQHRKVKKVKRVRKPKEKAKRVRRVRQVKEEADD